MNNLSTKILIIEDEIIIADYILEILNEEHFKNIKVANDEKTALVEMKSFLPDIILMDINLNAKNSGIELTKSKNDNATVIYITGQYDFALMNKALKTKPAAYLTKPIKKIDLLASINLAIRKKQTDVFQFKDGYDTVFIDYNDVLYINADGNYLHIYTIGKKYTIRQTLTETIESLPNDTFKQIHRSYIVNISKVTRKSNGKVFLNDINLPISRKYDKVIKTTD